MDQLKFQHKLEVQATQGSAVKHGGGCGTLALVAGAAPVQKLELDCGLKGRDDHVGWLDVPVVPPVQLVHGVQHLYGTHVMSASEESLDSRCRDTRLMFWAHHCQQGMVDSISGLQDHSAMYMPTPQTLNLNPEI